MNQATTSRQQPNPAPAAKQPQFKTEKRKAFERRMRKAVRVAAVVIGLAAGAFSAKSYCDLQNHGASSAQTGVGAKAPSAKKDFEKASPLAEGNLAPVVPASGCADGDQTLLVPTIKDGDVLQMPLSPEIKRAGEAQVPAVAPAENPGEAKAAKKTRHDKHSQKSDEERTKDIQRRIEKIMSDWAKGPEQSLSTEQNAAKSWKKEKR